MACCERDPSAPDDHNGYGCPGCGMGYDREEDHMGKCENCDAPRTKEGCESCGYRLGLEAPCCGRPIAQPGHVLTEEQVCTCGRQYDTYESYKL